MTKHSPAPWRLVSVEDERCFAIVAADGRHIARPHTIISQENHAAWNNPRVPAAELWAKIADDKEQATARTMIAAPDLLAGAVQILTELDSTEHDVLSPLMIHSQPLRDALGKLGVTWPGKR